MPQNSDFADLAQRTKTGLLIGGAGALAGLITSVLGSIMVHSDCKDLVSALLVCR